MSEFEEKNEIGTMNASDIDSEKKTEQQTPPRYVDNTAKNSYYGYSNQTSGTASGSYGASYTGSGYTRSDGYGSSAGNTYRSGAYAGGTGSTAGTSYQSGGYGSASGNPYQSTGYGSYSGRDYQTGGYVNNNDHTKPVKKKKEKKGKVGIALAIVAVLLVGVLVGGGISYSYLSSRIDSVQAQVDSQKNQTATVNKADRIETNRQSDKSDEDESLKDTIIQNVIPQSHTGEGMSVAQIVSNNLSSVVAITNYGVTEIRTMWGNFTQDSKSMGTGVIIAQTDDELLILTNYHVVADNNSLSVVFSWEENEDDVDNTDIINAVIKDYDEARDIAVIAIKTEDLSEDTMDKITVATIGDSDKLMLGEQVVAIGNALGYGQSVTSGVVSALNRKMAATDQYGNVDNNTYIQTDAAINEGNSGGALFNMQGELVGINSAKIGGSMVDSVGYAIPISDIIDEVEEMMNQETRETVSLDQRGWLGVSIVDVTEEISMTYDLPMGIYISAVDPGSGAEAAGIKKEDVITAINGKSISTGSELKDYLAKYAAGETVTLTVSSSADGYEESRDVEVTLGANPNVTNN